MPKQAPPRWRKPGEGKRGPRKGAKGAGRPRKKGVLGQNDRQKQSSMLGHVTKSAVPEEQPPTVAAAHSRSSDDVGNVEGTAADKTMDDVDPTVTPDVPRTATLQAPSVRMQNPYLQQRRRPLPMSQPEDDGGGKPQAKNTGRNKDSGSDDGGSGSGGIPGSDENLTVGDPRTRDPSWSESHLSYFKRMKEHLSKVVKLIPTSSGTRIEGKWPLWAAGIIDPRRDPVLFNSTFLSKVVLGRDEFALPPLLFCCPEVQFSQYYINGLPMCIWCKSDRCVESLGWGRYPRHCYDTDGVTALWGKRYMCTERKKANTFPYSFQAYSAESMALAPPYVAAWWRRNGFRCTWTGAVRWKVISDIKTDVVNGMSFLGAQRRLEESYKNAHLEQSELWSGYVGWRLHHPAAAHEGVTQAEFYQFDTKEFGGSVPSLAYLIKVVTEDIESRMEYYTRRQQMIDGRHLRMDHSHKVTKCILLQGVKGFVGVYSVMNEYGQISGWWLVYGTALSEIEGRVRQLAQRYKQHGFVGPDFVTVDRCCDEGLWEDVAGGDPVFESFVETSLENADEEKEAEGSELMQTVVKLPRDPEVPSNITLANVKAGEICDYVAKMPKGKRAVGLDCEWTPAAGKAGLVQIGLDNGSVYLFHVARFASFPGNLTRLLEDEKVFKVGNRIHNDIRQLAAHGVTVQGAVELGHMAHDRGVSPTRAPSLDFLIKTLFRCVLEKDPVTRLSRWNDDKSLTDDQTRYAALDAYASIKVFLKLLTIPCVKPTSTGASLVAGNFPVGSHVHLFARDQSSIVATGFVSSHPSDGAVSVVIREDDIVCPGALLLDHDCSILSWLNEKRLEDSFDGNVDVLWQAKNLRLVDASVGAEVEITTETKNAPSDEIPLSGLNIAVPEVTADSISSDDNNSDYDGDDEDYFSEDDEVHSEMAESPIAGNVKDAIDNVDHTVAPVVPAPVVPPTTRVAGRRRRRRRRHWSSKRTKQDLLHIFKRWGRVLSKRHGCFKEFMHRMKDAFFAVNLEDLEAVKQCLRDSGLSDKEIEKKYAHDYRWFLRRVRRHVPAPDQLKDAFDAVVATFADVTDAKTGKKFFSNKAWKQYRQTIKHMENGCLSDIPGISYYYELGTDKLGIPILKCIRGTSALEGFHQHIRQLIRGYALSPRVAIALLTEFIHRWNQDISVTIRGLDKRYHRLYEGGRIESQQAEMLTWPELSSRPHENFLPSTRAFASTGEEFGLIADANLAGSLDEEAERLGDVIQERELEIAADGIMEDGRHGAVPEPKLAASALWMCQRLDTPLPFTRVSGSDETAFFKKHYLEFQVSAVGRDANSYGFLNFSRFAEFWNRKAIELHSQKKPPFRLKLKNAGLLKTYFDFFRECSNESATLLSKKDEIKTLKSNLRDPARSDDVQVAMDAVPVARPDPRQSDSIEGARVHVPAFVGASSSGVTNEELVKMAEVKKSSSTHQKKRRKVEAQGSRKGKRCRRCGHNVKHQAWTKHHVPKLGDDGRRPHTFCSVGLSDFAEGFPQDPENPKFWDLPFCSCCF